MGKNPVYPSYFADPFVWQHQGTYYAVGTGAAEAAGQVDPSGNQGRGVFPLLTSADLEKWSDTGRSLERPPAALGDSFWAPEVAFHDGVFFLYYSVGFADRGHHLRVATSSSPRGPYRDVGRPLLDPGVCPFAIDPHPFRDDNGQWYLFYARDFLDTKAGARAGTALAVRPLETMTCLSPDETIVLRASWDWQRFQKDRPMYGGVYDWHTLEGPSVRKHAGHYYCFYSGGRWETESYGVDYAIADQVLGPYSSAGGEHGPRVLRSVPGQYLGPGHNSVTIGPDGQTEYVIYHAWDPGMTARRMFISPLLWTKSGPRCEG